MIKVEYLIIHKQEDFMDVICTSRNEERAKAMLKKFAEYACWNYSTEISEQSERTVTFTNGTYARVIPVQQCNTIKDLKKIGYAL